MRPGFLCVCVCVWRLEFETSLRVTQLHCRAGLGRKSMMWVTMTTGAVSGTWALGPRARLPPPQPCVGAGLQAKPSRTLLLNCFWEPWTKEDVLSFDFIILMVFCLWTNLMLKQEPKSSICFHLSRWDTATGLRLALAGSWCQLWYRVFL